MVQIMTPTPSVPLVRTGKYWVAFYSSLGFCVVSILEILPAWMTGGVVRPVPIIASSIIFRITNDQRMVESEYGLRESTLWCPEANDESQMLRMRRRHGSTVCADVGQTSLL
jgi:hypothetical protein